MDLNERYKDIDVGYELDKRFFKDGFSIITKEIRQELKAIMRKSNAKDPANIAYLLKIFEGNTRGYYCKENNFIVFAWTSWIPSLKRWRKAGKMWVGIIDLRNPQIFWAFPMNRVGDFIDRLENTARIYKEKVSIWPHCSHCLKMLFWEELFTFTEDEKEIANEQFPLRFAICNNPRCIKRGEKVMLVSDIRLENEEDNKFFLAPFKRYAKMLARNAKNEVFRLPRRLWTWLHRHGIIRRRTPLSFDDRENELKAGELGWPDYYDLNGQDDPNLFLDEPPPTPEN